MSGFIAQPVIYGGKWFVDVHGIWHKDRGDGILECMGAPIFGDGTIDGINLGGVTMLAEGDWPCTNCRAKITQRIVEGT